MDKLSKRLLNEEGLPLLCEPANGKGRKEDLLDMLKNDNRSFKELLLKHGGLLFRNFSLENAQDFADVMAALNTGKGINYIGGDSPRDKIKGNIYTSTEAPPSVKIPLHNELSFVKNYPRHIYFFCEIPPVEKGETIIGDARRIYQSIDPEVRKRFTQRKLKYVSRYYYKSGLMSWINKLQRCHKTWIDVFETENKKEVEKKCRENDFAYKWTKNDWIEISQIRPAVMKHPETGDDVWFNQTHLYDYNPKLLGWWRYLGAKILYMRKHMLLHEIFFADGGRIPREDLYHIMDTLDANTLSFPWQKGDLLVLDNVSAMHGRATFTGKRRILTAMTS